MNSQVGVRTVIRTAVLGDEFQIAKVHIQSWQEAYFGLVPQNYLDKLPLELEERINMWKRILANPQRWAWVAENSQGIVGFVLFGPPRDVNRGGFIELGAIYLLASEKGRGTGFSLLSAGFNKMKDLGYKRAYCWVLENNPTIKFYERSGASYTGQTKQDEIGGKNFNELAYEWNSLSIGDYNWKPLSVVEVKKVFEPFKSKWWIAGGWAIDLFLKKQTRPHDDIDVLIRREDQLEIQDLLADWDLWAADPPGTLKPWAKGEFLKKGLQDIWGRKTPKDPWQIQIMLFDTENGDWIFKRDESIRRSLESVAITTHDGLFLLAPEVQLLYKSKSLRAKDQQDFQNAIIAMSDDQKSWLKVALKSVYKEGHIWLNHL
jgi:ribosomal protein S18 acetylase RimI-like enzyme